MALRTLWGANVAQLLYQAGVRASTVQHVRQTASATEYTTVTAMRDLLRGVRREAPRPEPEPEPEPGPEAGVRNTSVMT